MSVSQPSSRLLKRSTRKSVGGFGALWADLKKTWHLYLFLLPTFAFIIIFRYYPAGSAIYHAFTRWNGAGIVTWVGLGNFEAMLADIIFIASLKNIGIILIAALIKVLIFPLAAAELIFNLKNVRAQYWFRLLLIISLVVPGIVNTLIWRFIMGPRPFGILNAFLEIVGLEHLQHAWLAEPKIALYSVLFVGFPSGFLKSTGKWAKLDTDNDDFVTSIERFKAIDRGNWTADAEELRAMHKLAEDWVPYWSEGFLGLTSQDVVALFARGEAAFMWNGSWYYPTILNDTMRESEFAVARFPLCFDRMAEIGDGGPTQYPGGAYNTIAMTATATRQGTVNQCVDYMKHFTSCDSQG